MRHIQIPLIVVIFAIATGAGCGGTPPPSEPTANTQPAMDPSDSPTAAAPSYEQTIVAIAEAIEARKGDFSQLAEFSASKHCDSSRLVITYDYHTHPPTTRGGWTAATPEPDDDGVWLYIDFHDPSSTAQIHTQPVVPPRHLGGKKVMLLLREGEDTEGLGAMLAEIMAAHGVEDGPPP